GAVEGPGHAGGPRHVSDHPGSREELGPGVSAGAAEFLYLTTTGRRTGLSREIEIWFTEHRGRYYVIAEHRWDARWVQNLQAEPRASVRLGDRVFAARTRVVTVEEPELLESVRTLSEKKYGWGDGLVVELAPERPASANPLL